MKSDNGEIITVLLPRLLIFLTNAMFLLVSSILFAIVDYTLYVHEQNG